MATALHVDKLPLVSEEESGWQEADWEHVPNIHQDNINDEPNNNRYSTLIEEDDDDEEEEIGVKGVADVDYTPQQEDCCIDLQKGDIVVIHGQTLDQKYFRAVNLRTGKRGDIPCHYITLESDEGFGFIPAKSNLQRGKNVVRRKRSGSGKDRSRRTGSDFSSSFPLPSGQGLEPDPNDTEPVVSKKMIASLPNENDRGSPFVRSESYATTLPVQYRRLEKYKVLSISGTDKMGRPVILFSACRLPPSYQISHDVLFEYIKYTLDHYVESDYTLVYFHHGLTSVNKPNYSWLYQFYKELDRKYKKNLKRLYVVHPTNFVKIMMGFFKPLISMKFGKKLVYVNRLAELDSVLYIDQIDIPKEVSDYDKTLRAQPRPYLQTESRSSFFLQLDQSMSLEDTKTQFGVHLNVLHERTGDEIPLVMRKCIDYLTENGLNVLGVFRRTPSQFTVQQVKKKFNSGEDIDFTTYADPHLAATTLKMFLRELPEPLLCFRTNSLISQLKYESANNRIAKCREIVETLPSLNYNILNYLLSFINKVIAHQDINKMSSTNLSIVLGPNLLWSKNEIASLNSMSEINRFTLLIIDNYTEVFVDH